MSSSFNRIKKNIIEAMQSTNNQGTSAYDSVAEVRRVDGDTAWVHIAGGVDETPVKLTMAAKAGDTVQVRVGGGRAWITGNASAPPTDDKTAIAAKGLANIAGNRANVAQTKANEAENAAATAQSKADSAGSAAENAANAAGAAGTAAKQAYNEAQNAKKTATNYLSDLSNGVYVHAEGTTADPTASTAKGVRITDVVDVIRNGTSVAEFGNGTVTLGKHNTVNDNYMVLASDGLHFGCMEQEALAFLADIDNGMSTFQNGEGIIFEDESENQQAVFDYMNGDFWFNGPISTVGRVYQAGHSGTYGFIGARKVASLSSDKTIKTDTGTAVCSISLEAGVWLILCSVRWSSNSSGVRRCNFATTSGSTEINYQIGACNGVCQIRWPTLVAPTATTTYYLNAYQNSGSSLTLPSTGNEVTAIRLV